MQHGLIEFYRKHNFLPLEGVLVERNIASLVIEWSLKSPGDLEWYGPIHRESVVGNNTAYPATRTTVITKKTPR